MSIEGKWPIEGKEHASVGINDIYTNGSISNFLNNENIEILIASKGMGKTLLLRAKKKIIEEKNSKDHKGYLIIPRNKEFDEPNLSGTISSTKVIQDIESWKNIWEICIIFSILSHIENHRENPNFEKNIEEFFYFDSKLDYHIREYFCDAILNQENQNPSFYLAEIFSKASYAEIEQFVKYSSKVYNLSEKYITSQVLVFIDAFDQTLEAHFSDNIDLWKNAQLGLLKAIHKLHVHNKHIKVFSSIRQEAFSGFKDSDRAVIKGKSLILEYSKQDLYEILLLAVKKYTKKRSLEEFIGFKTILNSFVNSTENTFDYIYRHSIYTPRSIISFGKRIYEIQNENEKAFKDAINNEGSSNLIKEYILSEKLMLLKNLTTEEEIENFLKLIPSNILHIQSLNAINQVYAKSLKIDSDDCHPFCELFNIGVIGQALPDVTTPNVRVQNFKKPHQYNWKHTHIINTELDNIFLIHPSLYEKINSLKSSKYRINKKNIIGDEIILSTEKPFPSIFISHSSLDNKFIQDEFMDIFERKMNLLYPVKIWVDENQISAGSNFHKEIEQAIKDSAILIVIFSKDSINSNYVDAEWRTKHLVEVNENKIKVIPLIIDETEVEALPSLLATKKAMKIEKENLEKSISKLTNDIFKHLLDSEII